MGLVIVEQAGLTDVGRQRSRNEDSFLEAAGLFAVADGMGGARAGEVASRIAVETLAGGGESDGSPERRLAEVAETANRKIYELAQSDESSEGMGTTLTAVAVTGGEVAIGHVGDSRLYRYRDGELERLTRDHSLVEELVRRGELEPEEVESHPQRSIITRALGPEPEVEVETFTCPGRDGDVYMLCSDGLSGMVPDDDLGAILADGGSLEGVARRLVDAANDNGGRDNITVVLFRLGVDDEAGESADTLTGQETRTSLNAEDVKAESERARGDSPAPTVVPDRPRASRRPRAGSRRRAVVTGALIALAVVVLLVGFYIGSRQFYFVGTSQQGLVSLYRGLPYDLPAGLELYEFEYATAVPAASIDARQREAILGHDLRSRGDAIDLIRQLEQGMLRS